MRPHMVCLLGADWKLISLDLIESHPDPEIDDSYYINWSLEDPYGEWHEEGSEYGSYQDPGSVDPLAEEWTEEPYPEGEEYPEEYSEEEDDLDQ